MDVDRHNRIGPAIGVVGLADGWSSGRLTEAFARKTGWSCLIDMNDVVVDFSRGSAHFHDIDLCGLDALVIKKIGARYSADLLDRLAMLRFIEHRGPRVFSRPAVIKRLLDRLSCTVTLRACGIPMPATVVTENLDHAVAAVHRFGRAVLKPLYTSKAKGMAVVEAGDDTREAVSRFQNLGNPVLYVQEFLPDLNYDLGVAFLGGRFLGCYARVRNKDAWNTTTRSGGKYRPHEPDPEVVELARRAQEPFDLDFTCVDIAETDHGPMVFEVSAFGGFRGLLQAGGIDAADHYADHVLEQLRNGNRPTAGSSDRGIAD